MEKKGTMAKIARAKAGRLHGSPLLKLYVNKRTEEVDRVKIDEALSEANAKFPIFRK